VSTYSLLTTCAALATLPLPTSVPPAGDVTNVPAGSHLAVQTRIEKYAAGCADVGALVPNATTAVNVAVYDLPLSLAETNLEATVTFVPDAAGADGWAGMLDAAIASAEGAFVPASAAGEGGALLDAMRAAVPAASQAAFDAGRMQGAWDTNATSWLEQHGPSLSSRAASWLGAGKSSALGVLAAHLGPGRNPGLATVTLESFAGFDAASAGLSLTQNGQFAWTADADDTVHLEGTVHVAPTALAARAADAQAAAQVPGSTGVASALAGQIDCVSFASALVGNGSSYPMCDATCTASLCARGLAGMWNRAAGASGAANDDLLVQITASAAASVAVDAARPPVDDVTPAPARLAGTWVGRVGRASSATFPMQGPIAGQNTQIVK
jgi:hypothetical protein